MASGESRDRGGRPRTAASGGFGVTAVAGSGVAAGWFGAVSAQVLPRIGDVVVATSGEVAVVDSRHQRPQLLALIGLHGSLTVEETAVPLLSVLGSKVG